MEMNDVQRHRMDVWNYVRLHTPEVGGQKAYNGVQWKCHHCVISITLNWPLYSSMGRD
jgi:hypothetical protein